jgi:protein DGCR14
MEPTGTSMPPPAPVGTEEAARRKEKVKRRRNKEEDTARHTGGSGVPSTSSSSSRRRVVALDEDDWVTRLEGIIERDFFPEIPKLQSKLEWLLAVNSGDAEMIKQAQRNTALRRAGFKTPLHAKGKGKAREEREWNTPLREAEGGRSEWDEAVLSLDRDSALNSPTAFGAGDGDSEEEEEQQQPVVPKLSLDQFCQRYTSEDNESFGEVLAQANCRVREKRDRLFSSVKRLEGPPATQTTTDGDGYGSSNQPSANNLITWPHRPMNKLFYDSTQTGGAASITEKEKTKLYVKGPEKQIVHRNTRINPNDGSNAKATAARLTSIFGSPSSMSVSNTPSVEGDYLVGGRRGSRGAGATPASVSRGFIASPSPVPGVEESPFMTWGEVEGTPVLIKPMPERERIAHNLVHSNNSGGPAGSSFKAKVGKAQRTNHQNLTPKLSAAGLRLASRLRKKKSTSGSSSKSFRNTIRESYTPTPHHHQ